MTRESEKPLRAKGGESSEASRASSITVRGRVVATTERDVSHTELRYFVDNPRVYSLVRSPGPDPTQEEIEAKLQEMEHVRVLVQDIKRHGGLIDPLFVKDGTLEVIEGNSRLAAWRLLASQAPLKWTHIRCVVLPHDIEPHLVSALLGQWHLKGKKEWPPYEQAGYLYRRHKEDGIAIPDLAQEVGLNKTRVRQSIEAYDFMVRHSDTERDRFSYYYEYVKSPKIRRARKKFAQLDELVVGQVKGGQIMRAQDLRDKLPVVCEKDRILRAFVRDELSLDEAHERAVTAGGRHSPYQRLHKFRLWLADQDIQAELVKADGSIGDQIKFELNKLNRIVQKLCSKVSG